METGGPCYRCLFPKPPPIDSVISCGDGGILGPVVGVMGVLQASRAIKIIVTGESITDNTSGTTMLLYAENNASTPFRNIRVRGRKSNCFACSSESTLTLASLSGGGLDYVQFCGAKDSANILPSEHRIDAKGYAALRSKNTEHLLIDVRDKIQYDICNLDGSVNVPFSTMQTTPMPASSHDNKPEWMPETARPDLPIYIVCRLGNDSQVAVKKLREACIDGGQHAIVDIKGGFHAWKRDVDSSWPAY